MTGSPGLVVTVLAFLAVIGPLIFVHELGHYFAGRAFGVKADAFSIGFGREVFGWTDGRGTRWKLALLPLGGYVKFAGDMSPASEPTEEWLALPAAERNRTFQAKPLWQKAIIVAAGPAVNFLFAIAVYAALFGSYGDVRTPPVVTAVSTGSGAAAAGIQAGDRIVEVDGTRIDRFEDIADVVKLRPDETVAVRLLRAGKLRSTAVHIGTHEEHDRFGNTFRIGRLGVAATGTELVKLRPQQVLGAAVTQVYGMVSDSLKALGQVITGRRSAKELGGPLKIAQFAGQQATLGWPDFVWFMAAISINLGFINLLPVPILDGGHLMFYAIQAVRRRPLSVRAQDLAFRTGLALILALMLFVTLNDLTSFGLWKGIAGLIARG